MDKLQMAHDWAMKHGSTLTHKTVIDAWAYADAMQAEAEKRNKEEAAQKRKEMREMLNADNTFIEREGQHFDDVYGCEVDWRVAPDGAAAYIKLSVWVTGVWIDDLGFQISDAPSFGFTGSHIVERPHGF